MSVSSITAVLKMHTSIFIFLIIMITGEKSFHCDIKPDNIMICDGEPKLIDFGSSEIDSECKASTPFFYPKIVTIGEITNNNDTIVNVLSSLYPFTIKYIAQLNFFLSMRNELINEPDIFACTLVLFLLKAKMEYGGNIEAPKFSFGVTANEKPVQWNQDPQNLKEAHQNLIKRFGKNENKTFIEANSDAEQKQSQNVVGVG